MPTIADINLLGAAVVAELISPDVITWNQAFTPTLVFRIKMDVADVGPGWNVHVAEIAEEREIVLRSNSHVTLDVDVAIQKKVNPDDPAEVAPVLDLQEQMAVYWLGRRPETLAGYKCLKVKKIALWIPEHLDQKRVCTSVLRLSFETFGD